MELYCMREWWVDNVGQNLLKGVDGDADNPIRLTDVFIHDFLRRIPAARESFNRLFPTLLPEERERLTPIAESATFVQPDHKEVEDEFQRRQNTAGIHTTGPRGGGRFGGNVG